MSTIDCLSKLGVSPETMEKEFCTVPVPAVFKLRADDLEDAFERLYSHFELPEDHLHVLCLYLRDTEPYAAANLRKLFDRLEFLSLIMLNTESLDNYVGTSPYLLTLEKQVILDQIENLSKLFRPRELRHLLRNAPNLLLEPWSDTQRKIYYVFDEMGLDQPHISYNDTLSHPLSYIRNRHEFLVRLGKYVKPRMQKDRLSYMQNAKIEDIMSCSDDRFCRRIADVDEDEWRVFEELMAQEEEERREREEEQEELMEGRQEGREYAKGRNKWARKKGQHMRGERWRD